MKQVAILGAPSPFAMAAGAIIARQYVTQQQAKRQEAEFAAFIKAKEDSGEIPRAPCDEDDPGQLTEGELDEMVVHPTSDYESSRLEGFAGEVIAISETGKWTDEDMAKFRAKWNEAKLSDKPGKVLTPGALAAMEKAEQRRERRRKRNLRLSGGHAPCAK